MTKEEFVGKVENWDGHRVFLWKALGATTGKVIELGMGKGSTKQLHDYCENRLLFSYEYDFNFYKRFKNIESPLHQLMWIENWNDLHVMHEQGCDVLFVDHSPGERRKIDIAYYANKAQILVIHDTEKEADHGYQMLAEINKFKYIINDETFPARTTMCSNFIDVTKL